MKRQLHFSKVTVPVSHSANTEVVNAAVTSVAEIVIMTVIKGKSKKLMCAW